MASDEDGYNVMEHPIEVKEEKIEIDDNEPCSLNCANTQLDLDEHRKETTYDEIVSSIETIIPLQTALIDDDQYEEECVKNEIWIKQEMEFEGSHPSEGLDNMESDFQDCITTSKSDDEHMFENAASDDSKEASSDPGSKIFCELISLISSNSEDTTKIPSVSYREVGAISGVKEESTENKRDLFPLEINLNKPQDLEVAKSVDKYSANTEVNSKFVPKAVNFVCDSGRKSISNKIIEGETFTDNCQYPSEDGINIVGPPIRRKTKNQLNRKERESNISKMEVSTNKRTIETKSSGSMKSTIAFCGSKLKMNTHSKEKTYECSICQKKFQAPCHLKVHVRIHTGEKSYKCEICEYKFTQKSQLTQHVRTHSPEKPYKCDLCEYKCTSNSNLRMHLRIHLGDRPYKCEICDYKFTQSSSLNRHMKTHSGEKPFGCAMCEYKCIQKSLLNRHMRTHTRQRPYQCELCDYKCTQRFNLNVHMRTHSGDKPYKCETCENKFTQKSSLEIHMRKHTGRKPYQCQICKHKFTTKYNLKMHTRKHLGERPYNCEICDYKCTRKGKLRRHMKSHTQN